MYFVKFLFLFSKLEQRIYLSHSHLESREYFFWFLFLFSKLGKGNSYFSYSSPNWRNNCQISLSLLDWTFLPLVNHCFTTHSLFDSDAFVDGDHLEAKFVRLCLCWPTLKWLTARANTLKYRSFWFAKRPSILSLRPNYSQRLFLHLNLFDYRRVLLSH